MINPIIRRDAPLGRLGYRHGGPQRQGGNLGRGEGGGEAGRIRSRGGGQAQFGTESGIDGARAQAVDFL